MPSSIHFEGNCPFTDITLEMLACAVIQAGGKVTMTIPPKQTETNISYDAERHELTITSKEA